jgi:hypothetical protein
MVSKTKVYLPYIYIPAEKGTSGLPGIRKDYDDFHSSTAKNNSKNQALFLGVLSYQIVLEMIRWGRLVR